MSITVLLLVIIILLLPVPWLLYLIYRNQTTAQARGGPKPEGRGGPKPEGRGGPKPEGRGYTIEE